MENNIDKLFNDFEELEEVKISYEDELLSKYLVTKKYLEENKLNEGEELLSSIIDKIEKENI
ncbi:MAG: hypothetical protein ACI4WW_07975 [Candidatus Coprovivens sp.]